MRFVFAFIALFFCFACNNQGETKQSSSDSSHKSLPPPQYYFYPRANVYFDSVNKDYVFQTGDSAGWTAQKRIPAAVQNMMDKGVLIQNPSQPVWKDNANHRLIYSAALYATAADTVEKKEKPPPVKADTAVKKEERRSGFRRFFDKLFGKKKKKKDAGK